jgi:diadenosine tetraphosphate (Ap4A) HIT family hydrolase
MTEGTSNQRKADHQKRNCLFCRFAGEIDIVTSQVAKRRLQFKGAEKREDWDKNCFAILDRSPKSLGHALVIARFPFNDFTDEMNGKKEEKGKVFEASIWLANRIKEVLKAEKVYITSICEHWEMWETSNGTTTEHLHFNLIPRYRGMRTKEKAAEKLLCKEVKEWTEEDLENFAKWFNSQ